MKWPDPRREPLGGWRFENNRLISPEGQSFKPGDFLTTPQVAAIRGTSPGYMIGAVRRGTIPATKFGHTIAIAAADALIVTKKGPKKSDKSP